MDLMFSRSKLFLALDAQEGRSTHVFEDHFVNLNPIFPS